jgi:hypothetical protein
MKKKMPPTTNRRRLPARLNDSLARASRSVGHSFFYCISYSVTPCALFSSQESVNFIPCSLDMALSSYYCCYYYIHRNRSTSPYLSARRRKFEVNRRKGRQRKGSGHHYWTMRRMRALLKIMMVRTC